MCFVRKPGCVRLIDWSVVCRDHYYCAFAGKLEKAVAIMNKARENEGDG